MKPLHKHLFLALTGAALTLSFKSFAQDVDVTLLDDTAKQPLKLWYNQPAGSDWNAALPIGNGRLGAMVYGGVSKERLQLNEDTVWEGYKRDGANPAGKEALPEIRRL